MNIKKLIMIILVFAIVFSICTLTLFQSFADVDDVVITQSEEEGVDFELTLPEGTVGVPYNQEATTTQLISGFIDKNDPNYNLYLMLAQSAKITSISLENGTLPSGLSISSTSTSASFKGTPEKSGNYTFYVRIGVLVAGSSSYSIAKVFIKINQPQALAPVFIIKPNASYETERGERLSVSVSSSCADGCDLVLYIFNTETSQYLEISRKSNSLSWIFDPLALSGKSDTAGNYSFKLTAVNLRDSSKFSEELFTVKIYDKVLPPEIPSISGTSSCSAGETVTFTCSASGYGLKYEWFTKRTSESEFKSVSSDKTFTLNSTVYDDNIQIKCIVSNSAGQSESNTITLAVSIPHTHSFGSWTVSKAPTCTAYGTESAICTCGAVKTREILPTGHNYSSEWTVETAATCTQDGTKSHRCLSCGDKSDITVITASGHKYGAWIQLTAPTLTTEGSEKRVCTVCNDTQLQSIPKLVTGHTHSFSIWVTLKQPTCTESGSRQSTCSCGEIKTESITASGHKYSEDFVIVESADCTKDGLKAKICSVCGNEDAKTVIPAAGHSMGNWTVIKEASVTEEGIEARTCSVCDYQVTQSVAKLVPGHKHSFGEWYVSLEALCETAGEESRICNTCGVAEKRITPPIGHSYGMWKVTTEAGCLTEGVETSSCSCGSTLTRAVAAHGHSFEKWIITVVPSENAIGQKTRTCLFCNAVEYDEVLFSEYSQAHDTPSTPDASAFPTVTDEFPNPETSIAPTQVPQPDYRAAKTAVIIMSAVFLLAVVVFTVLRLTKSDKKE